MFSKTFLRRSLLRGSAVGGDDDIMMTINAHIQSHTDNCRPTPASIMIMSGALVKYNKFKQ